MSLISWYKLDGNALDSVGVLHGTPSANIIWANGKIGQCAEFNGVDTTIRFGMGSDLFPLYSFSLSIWFKSFGTTPITGEVPGIFGLTYSVSLAVYNTKLVYMISNGVSYVLLHTPENYNFYTDDQWHHVVCTASPTEIKIFIDGEIVASRSFDWPGNIIYPTNDLFIGRDRNSTNLYFRGLLDDFRIYDHALSAKEVKELSKAKILHYKFDNANDIIDVSGYDNHAVVSANLPTLLTEGRVGNGCAEFDGSKTITTSKLFHDNVNQSWTVSAWVYATDLSVFTSGSQKLNNFNVGNEISHTGNQKSLLYMNSGVNDAYAYSSGIIPENQWVHMTYVLNTSTLRCQIYINGLLNGSSGNYDVSDIPYGFAPTTIFGQNFIGKLDDIRIYATDLSSNDILELYQTMASVDRNGNVFNHSVKEVCFNRCPPVEEWILTNGAYLDGDEIVIPSADAIAETPFIYVDEGTGFRIMTECLGYEQSPAAAAPAGTSGRILGTNYFDENFAARQNTAGYTGNGNAQYMTIGEWERTYWTYSLGNGIRYMKIRASYNSSYIGPSGFRFRIPVLAVQHMDATPFTNLEYTPFSNEPAYFNQLIQNRVTDNALLSSVKYSEIGPTQGLIGYWPLDGDTDDYSGGNFPSVNNGAVASSGIKGLSYLFDGVDDYIDTGDKFNFTKAGEFSASFWLNPNDHSAREGAAAGLVGKGHWESNTWDIFLRNTHLISFEVSGDPTRNGYKAVQSLTIASVGVWTHCTATYKNGTMKLYINGVLEGSNSYIGIGDFNNTWNVQIGRRIDDLTRSFSGKMQDVRIYNRSLSDKEIGLLYNNTNPTNKISINRNTMYINGEIKEIF